MTNPTAPAKRYTVVLTTDGDWDVHRAGCADVAKARTRNRANSIHDALAADPYAAVLDDELREMGYSESDVNAFPCCKDA